jgi:hypothetical protein
MEIGVKYMRLIPTSIISIVTMGAVNAFLFLGALNETLPYFVDFCLIWIKLGTRVVRSSLLCCYEFSENWCTASCTLPKDVNENLYVLSTFIAQFWASMT